VYLEDQYVDATWSPMEVLKGWGQASTIKYTIEPYCTGYTSGFYVAMNLKKWKTLPKDVQRVFEEVSKESINKHAKGWYSLAVKSYLSCGNWHFCYGVTPWPGLYLTISLNWQHIKYLNLRRDCLVGDILKEPGM
jgi:hypothetical protein